MAVALWSGANQVVERKGPALMMVGPAKPLRSCPPWINLPQRKKMKIGLRKKKKDMKKEGTRASKVEPSWPSLGGSAGSNYLRRRNICESDLS